MENADKESNLTIQQDNIWLIEKLYENTNINNVTGIFYINNILDLSIMDKVMNEIIKTNDALRIRIKEEKGNPIQYIYKYIYEKIPIYKVENKKEVYKLLEEIKSERFNILNSKLYYIALIQDNTTTYVCVKTHHIISDAWTLGQVAEQIKINYNSIKNDITISKKPSYVEHIKRDEEYKISEKYLRDKEFWNEYIQDMDVSNSFESTKRVNSNRIIKKISKSKFKKIQNYCQANKISEYCFFLAIISIYFMRTLNRNGIVIGTPFLNRSKKDQELDMMGMFIATLPIKINIQSEDENFVTLCKEIGNNNLLCFKHSKYPYYEIQKQYQKNTGKSVNLYEIAFSYQINKLEEKIEGNTGKTTWLCNNSQANPILISYVNHFGEHQIYYDYLLDIFTKRDINQINSRIMDMIDKVISKDNIKINDIEVLSQCDIKMLREFNRTGKIKEAKDNIIDRFKDIVEKNKDNISIKCGEREITYDELDKKTNLIANNLKKLGINNNESIAIIFNKNIEMILAMLGILKTGAYYVPILPEEELKRAEYIIQNSDSKYIITDDDNEKKIDLKNIKVINIKKLLQGNEYNYNCKIHNEQIAYVIYTSGTTGTPKGVMMQHRNIISLIESINRDNDLRFIKGDISISLLKYSFDASAIDIYTSLLNGGKLILVPKAIELNPKEVVDIIIKEKVTRCFTVHKWIEQIQYYGKNKDLKLRVLGTGAEVLRPEKFKDIIKNNKNLKLLNTYGPTETTMFVTKHKISRSDINKNIATIGKLIPMARAVIMNNNKIMPINIKGELVIYEDNSSSKNISKGYYKLDEISKEKFVIIKVPYKKEKVKAYKTGDIVKINNNLELEFYGRKDDYIKVNGGYLVSLNEIEETIRKLLGEEIDVYPISIPIRDTNEIAVFIVKNGNAKNINNEEIEQVIEENVTFYMKPKRIIEIQEVPRNKNGKVDREKLLSIAKQTFINNKKVIAPTTDLERYIYEKVKDIIGQDFSITDDFEDDLGLDSLSITALYVALGNENIQIQDLYNYSTIRDLANMMQTEDKLDENKNDKLEILNNSKSIVLENILLTGTTGFLGANLLKELAYNETTQNIYCLVRTKLDKTSEERFKENISKYFSTKDIKQIMKKAIVIDGDLAKENLGINNNIFKEMVSKVNVIINSAANVKHIGKYKDFYKDNVLTVNNIINICYKYNISLVHISTLSLSGTRKNGKEQKKIFNENTLNIDQTFNKNPYLLSKYEAEKNIIKSANDKNINAKIFRIGNIMPRLSDGKFQSNFSQNAFMLAIKEIIKLKMQNADMLNKDIFLTPSDECAKAIVTILSNDNGNNNIYHIESDKPIKVSQFIEILKDEGESFKISNIEELNNQFYKNYNIGVEHLKAILEDMDMKYNNTITLKILNKCNFRWTELNRNYIENIINIARKIK